MTTNTTWRVERRVNKLGQVRFHLASDSWATYRELKMIYRWEWQAQRAARRMNRRELARTWERVQE